MKWPLIIIFIAQTTWACRFNTQKNVISLSGPMTYLFLELGLTKDPALRAISIYHGLSEGEFSKKRLAGGQFISSKVIRDFQSPLIFFDSSRELKRSLKNLKAGPLIEIDSRGLTPFEVFDLVKKKLIPYISGCEKELAGINQKVKKIKHFIDSATPFKNNVVFFLGDIKKNQRLPNLVINDGAVKYLRDSHKIETYPSELSYIPWSTQVMHKLEIKGKVIKIGLDGINRDSTDGPYHMNVTGTGTQFNITGPAILIPGLGQIYFLESFYQHFEKSHFLAKLHE